MKIDDMVKQEDFFVILQATLNEHFRDCGINIEIAKTKKKDRDVIYIYEKLNAIVAKNPSKEVKEFLKTEYAIKGSFLRKFMVKVYLQLSLHSRGLLSNQAKVYIAGINEVDFTNVLIYPCNKKIRVFNFNRQTVDVIVKEGFPSTSIKKEIEFRVKHMSSHIEPLINFGENWYRERIIDGKPLARIQDSEKYNNIKRKSLEALRSIADPYKRITNGREYKYKVIQEIKRISDELLVENSSIKNTLEEILKVFDEKLSGFNQAINLTLSHGDFHHGNIWVENSSNKIIIIDWETSAIRTEWYDVFTLFGGLREINGIKGILSRMSKNSCIDFEDFVGFENFKIKVLIVLLEDVLFRLVDLECTPIEIGIRDFEIYSKELLYQLRTN